MAFLTVWNSTYRKISARTSCKADVVVANILAGPLRELAPLISVLPVGSLLGLSGYSASQAESVCEAYADSFASYPVVESGAGSPVVRINLRHCCRVTQGEVRSKPQKGM